MGVVFASTFAMLSALGRSAQQQSTRQRSSMDASAGCGFATREAKTCRKSLSLTAKHKSRPVTVWLAGGAGFAGER